MKDASIDDLKLLKSVKERLERDKKLEEK